MDDFDVQLLREINTYLESIKADIAKILEDCIDKDLYQCYQPTEYLRTMQLKDSVRVVVEGNQLFVYIDSSALNYSSAVSGEKVSEQVPYYVNYGHNSSSNINNQYQHYQARNFMLDAQKQIQEKYGFITQILEYNG